MPNAYTMTMIERRICRSATPNRLAHACSSLLVPLMIGVFTIVTTVLQMNLAKHQREQDLQISKENREKDFEIANQTRLLQNQIEENRRIAEIKTQKDQEMNTVLATYLKDMAELMLFKNFTLTDTMIATVVRAKTLTTLGQLDGKRKGHIVRFLYEAQMILVGQAAVDLTDADLSNVDLTNYKLTNASFAKSDLSTAIFRGSFLSNINFLNVQLNGAYFENSILRNINFYEANLTNTSFIDADLTNVEFHKTIITKTNFTNVRVNSSTQFNAKGNYTIFNGANMKYANLSHSILINASFVKTILDEAVMTDAILDKANFTGARLFSTNLGYSKLSESIFDRSDATLASFYHSNLQGTSWIDTIVKNVDFSQANLHKAYITDDQLRQALKTFDIILPNGSQGYDTNLLANGDAEGQDGRCETNPWHVNSMIASKRYRWSRDLHIYGNCYFTKQLNTTQATMWQRVLIPNQYNEWIRTNMAEIQIAGLCACADKFALHVRQFNGNSNISLKNDTNDLGMFIDTLGYFYSVHPATTEIELEIHFTDDCGWPDEYGDCDNLKLAIWHRNYTF